MDKQFRSVIFRKACTHIENAYVDKEFIAKQWPALRDHYESKVDGCSSKEEFDALMIELLEKSLPLSHCAFITPEKAAEIAKLDSGDEIAEALQFSWKKSDDWLYLRLPSFTIPRFSFGKVLQILKKAKPEQYIVIDVRLNDGGSMSAVGELMGLFIGGERVICRTRLQNWQEMEHPLIVYPQPESSNQCNEADVKLAADYAHTEWRTAHAPPLYLENNLIVLVGQRCYSCGELFAQSVLDYGRGWLVGSKTAGCVVGGRDDYECGHGYRLLLPFVTMFAPAGQEIEGVGVSPHVNWHFASADTDELTEDEIKAVVTAMR